MSMTVTAAAGGGATTEIFLRVLVLDNAFIPASPDKPVTGQTNSESVSVTPAATGSKVYSAEVEGGGSTSPNAATGNTAIDSVQNAGHTLDHATFVSTGTTTAGTAFTAGSSDVRITPNITALEVQAYGGTPAQDASTPAAVFNQSGLTATTAAFTPPAGSGVVLLALISTGGKGTMAVTDTYGLTWTSVVDNSASSNQQATWIFYAPAPAALAISTPAAPAGPPAGTLGSSYSYTFAATGGYSTSYTWSVSAGTLPTGLSLSSAGVLSGTPSATGLFTPTIQVADAMGNTATLAVAIVINEGFTGTGFIRQGWTASAGQYTYGTLEVPVATTDHDWIAVAVSWQDGQDPGIAYCADDARNYYQPGAISSAGAMNTQVFIVPNAAKASTVYVSTSAYVRWLTVLVLDITGLQPGFTIDASNVYSGSGTTFTESLSTTRPEFVLSVGAFAGTPQAITQSGSGATWTALPWAGIAGNSTSGITQSAAWANPAGTATPSMQFTAASGNYSGCIIAIYTQGGLPANANPAWPVIGCRAAFGYTPQEPAAPPSWTDITSRFLGIKGQQGRSFELDEISAGDLTIILDNFDGALSPQNSASPYYPNVTLITPVQLTATWQGRTTVLFGGVIHAIPQTYDFQRGMVEVAVSDDFSKLAQTLLAPCMTQEMLYDKPLHLWPLNDQQGATNAGNWSGRSSVTLVPKTAPSGGGTVPATVQTVNVFGLNITPVTVNWSSVLAAIAKAKSSSTSDTAAPQTPTTGFGNSNSGVYPSGLAGSTETVWGNTSSSTSTTSFKGTILVDSNDSTLPLTSTGATYSVWAQIWNLQYNVTNGAVILTLTDQNGPGGTGNFLSVSYNGSLVTIAQTAGSHTFTPSSYLVDGKWHLWTVTVTTGGTVTLYVDGVSVGSFAGSFPAGTPTMLQLGGDATASTASAAGIFTGELSLGGVYDRVVDVERIQTWFLSGSTGFLDELGGTRIQRVLAWARWNAPQAVDAGAVKQQAFSYLAGGYGTNGLTGAIGHFATAGGSSFIDQGAQADSTVQDISNTENGFLAICRDGTIAFLQHGATHPSALPLGDTDYALNAWQTFESGLGPWTSTVSCTAAQSAGWSYSGRHSALVTVTGTPVTAYAWGDRAVVTPGEALGFSCWVMSPQGCTVQAQVDWYTSANALISTSSSSSVNVPPMTPVFLNLTGLSAPANAAFAYPHPSLVSSPATGTQLYFDRARLSPAGFQAAYEPDIQVIEDIQYLYNSVSITRNADQAVYRARNDTSRGKYYPRIYTRVIYSSVNDPNAVVNCANNLLNAYATPQLRVSRISVDAAANPELWPFVLGTDVGSLVSFTRNPVGGAQVTGTFMVLSVSPDVGPDRARFSYVLAPLGPY